MDNSCAVRSADMIPLKPVNVKKAISLVFRGSVYVIEEYDDVEIRTVSTVFPAPKVVVTKRFVKLPSHFYGPAILSPKNLRKRDNDQCQYCGRYKNHLGNHEFLTRDHVVPRSRGGEDTWENCVLACVTCNNKKGNKTLKESGMTLLRQPFVPNRWEL